MKKVISLIVITCILLGVGAPAFAKQNDSDDTITPFDGFSYGYSYSDPSGGGGYGTFGTPRTGNVIFETILASMLVSGIASAIVSVLPFSPAAVATANQIANYAAGAGATWALTSTKVYYKLYTAYHNQLPGFYQYLRYEWYTDSTYQTKICTTYVYRFKA